MNGLIRKLRDTRGDGLLLLLLVTPLLISIAMWRMDYNQMITHSDIDFNQSLKKAVKAATNQVTEKSQAEGDPRIYSEQANNAFRLILAENLKLNPVTMAPGNGSPFKSPIQYKLIVYNGDDSYSASGAMAVYEYDFDGINLSSYPLSGFGFPQQFAVSDFDIAYGTGGTFDVTLDAPGCVAIAKIQLKSITESTEIPVRWASAKIHYNN